MTGSDKLMAPPVDGGYPTEVLVKAPRVTGCPPPMAMVPPSEDGMDTISVREYKSRTGSEMAHVHLQQGQYGRAGFPYPDMGGTLGRPPSHVYESPKFS